MAGITDEVVLLEALNRLQERFIVGDHPDVFFDHLLAQLLQITSSEYGFIGEVCRDDDDLPFLRTFAITNIAWDDATRKFYDENAPVGMEFRNLQTLFGEALRTGDPVISNDPVSDPRSGGRPDGHPPLNAFLGVPLTAGGVMVGLVGLANRPGGYSDDFYALLAPLWSTASTLVNAHRTWLEKEDAQRERRELEVQYLHAQRLESLGLLAGGIAHDFNNLLIAAAGNADLVRRMLDRDPTSPEVLASLDEIEVACERAAGLTRQLLSFARQRVSRPTPLNVNTTVKRITGMLRRTLPEDISFEIDTARGLPKVLADESLIDQVVLNLILNSSEATRGQGKIRITTRLGHDQGLQGVIIEVTDDGEGMTPEVQERIFEPFFSTKSAGRGTGLGLSTVLGIVRQAGGQIDVKSAPGEGTRFTVFLPGTEAAPSELETTRESAAAPAGELILVCEDDPAVRRLTRLLLEDEGFRVVATSSPNEALAICDKTNDIALLLTDVVMPEMSGPELSRAILQRHPNLAVLMVTGHVGRGLEDAEGRWQVLEKPYSAETLSRHIRLTLSQSNGN